MAAKGNPGKEKENDTSAVPFDPNMVVKQIRTIKLRQLCGLLLINRLGSSQTN
jgi:hypothetical protein